MKTRAILTILAAAIPVLCLEWIGFYDTPGTAENITLEGRYAYVADGLKGIQVLDIADPTKPVLVSSILTRGYARNSAIEGFNVFVADWKEGFTVIDFSDIRNPSITGSYPLSVGWVNDLAVRQGYLYVAVESAGLMVFEITNPNRPVFTDSFSMPGGAVEVEILSDFLYVRDRWNQMWKLDLTETPETPVLVESFTSSLWSDRYYGNGGMLIRFPEQYNANAIQYQDGLVFTGFLENIQLSYGTWHTAGSVRSNVVFKEHIAMAAEREAGIQILNLSAPKVFAHNIPLPAYGVCFSGNTAFLKANSSVHSLDILLPDMPVQKGELRASCLLSGMAVSGTIMFLAYDSGIASVDVSDPANPVPTVPLSNYHNRIRKITIDGDIACATDASDGVMIFDINRPLSPRRISRFDTPGFAYGTAIRNNLVYVADHNNGLVIADITDPAKPVITGTIATAGPAVDVMLYENYAFVAEEDSGFEVFDLAAPASRVLAGRYDTPGRVCGFTLYGRFLIVADQIGRIPAYDISDPKSLLLVSDFHPSGPCLEVAVTGHYLYASSGGFGLDIFNLRSLVDNETAPAREQTQLFLSNSPNPFNPSTEIRFTLPSASHAEVSVFNAQGKRVSTLAKGNMAAGGHSIKWNGSSMPSGIYLFSLETEGGAAVRKAILAK